METLQRQQAARLAVEEKLRQAEKNRHFHSLMQSRIQQQALAFSRYHTAMGGPLAPGSSSCIGGARLRAEDEDGDAKARADGEEGKEEDADEQEMIDEEEEDEDMSDGSQLRESDPRSACLSPKGFLPTDRHQRAESPSTHSHSHQEWTYEEQFKQLYDLDDDEKRKEFLDDLFSFMQKRGTPVNRIPIMAKQVLDLYMLYKLVTEKGGLVEVINKKIWREITKGLHLPTSITSAAFTLRTQYMKYLYPYECEKRGLSSPGELQAAIDSNRRESRRQNYTSAIFSYSTTGSQSLLPTPKILPHVPTLSHQSSCISQSPMVKKEELGIVNGLPSRMALPISPSEHHMAALGAQAAGAQSAALEHLSKFESCEPTQNKMIKVTEEEQRIMEQALQQNLIALATQAPLSIKLNDRDDRQESALNLSTNGINSINMSIEINGVVYTGVLFARQSVVAGIKERHGKHNYKTQGKTNATFYQPSCFSYSSASLHGQRNSST
ncbi:AT-rich interactive domain-containing protein 3A [Cyprinodon tularosa]|uniref:AT-rich interactive domain-containing protein 3A n=1 Tax=Cyprinodon tularosa TaxID=77115 RepID=UPI0018E201E2|nr:AT-rich interactive domain-containing protein 3A [Cyprinodon tularosa]